VCSSDLWNPSGFMVTFRHLDSQQSPSLRSALQAVYAHLPQYTLYARGRHQTIGLCGVELRLAPSQILNIWASVVVQHVSKPPSLTHRVCEARRLAGVRPAGVFSNQTESVDARCPHAGLAYLPGLLSQPRKTARILSQAWWAWKALTLREFSERTTTDSCVGTNCDFASRHSSPVRGCCAFRLTSDSSLGNFTLKIWGKAPLAQDCGYGQRVSLCCTAPSWWFKDAGLLRDFPVKSETERPAPSSLAVKEKVQTLWSPYLKGLEATSSVGGESPHARLNPYVGCQSMTGRVTVLRGTETLCGSFTLPSVVGAEAWAEETVHRPAATPVALYHHVMIRVGFTPVKLFRGGQA